MKFYKLKIIECNPRLKTSDQIFANMQAIRKLATTETTFRNLEESISKEGRDIYIYTGCNNNVQSRYGVER